MRGQGAPAALLSCLFVVARNGQQLVDTAHYLPRLHAARGMRG
jgi:hypothetical protein